MLLESLPTAARQAFTDLQTRCADQQAENVRLGRIIQLKDEEIRLLNYRIFGPRSEKLSPAQITLLLDEVSVQPGEVAQEAHRPEAEKQNLLPKVKKPRANHPGRSPLPAHLER